MTEQVSSRFSISSKTLSAVLLAPAFPWPVTEAVNPGKVDHYITVYDLGTGRHSRVDHHLEAVMSALLKKERELRKLKDDSHYALWVKYRFPDGEGAFNLFPDLLTFFSSLRVEIIFHLNESQRRDGF